MGAIRDNITWVALIQILILIPLLMPGIVGLSTLYIFLGQAAVFSMAYTNEYMPDAVSVANGAALGVLVLAFMEWSSCSGPVNCVVVSSRVGVTVAIVIGIWLSNRFLLGLQEKVRATRDRVQERGDESRPVSLMTKKSN